MTFFSHSYPWQRICPLHFIIFSEIIFFSPGSSIRKIIWRWSMKYEPEDLEVTEEWVRRIACHLSWVLCSCKDPVQQMQLFRPASLCNFSSSISLKKCHQLLWSSILCKNRVLFNLSKVTLHNCLLTIAKWNKGKFCVLLTIVLAAVLLEALFSHCSLVVPAIVDRFYQPSFVLIH